MRTKTIEIPIYNREIIMLSGNQQDCIKWIGEEYGLYTQWNANASGYFVSTANSGGSGFIWCDKSTSYATLAHEAFHATHSIMDAIGGNLTHDSEESYAYLIGFIVDEWMDKDNWVSYSRTELNNYKKKKQKKKK